MATLFGTKIQDTYDGLLKVTDNIGITGTKQFITDGLGVNSSVKISSLDFEVANFFFIDVLSGQDPSNYKVGINTSAPTQMLHVTGNMRLTGSFYDSNNTTGTSGQILSSTVSGTDWVDITAIQTLSGSGTTNFLTKWTNTTVLGNSILYESSSKIGIGTITPSEKLHVEGNVAVGGQLNLLSSSEVYGILKPENSIIKFYAGDGVSATGTPTVIISGDGHSRLGIGVASPSEALHVVGDALITGDSHADAFKPAATTEPLKFKNFASTELMRITNAGNVGINNNNPLFTLDVTGTAKVSGDTHFVTQGNSDDSNKVATTAYVKNLIEEIPAGLIFQGTWNAFNNTPTLASGTGTTGHFYIVATDGSTNLDGITDWKVGDWAVFVEQGVTDQWEKIDNSSVLDGSGTGQKVTLWSGSGTSNTLTDAPITISGNDATFAGTVTATNFIGNSGAFLPLAGNTIATAMTGDIILANTQQVRFLTTANAIGLRLQSSGTNSFIDNEVGDMYIRQEADNKDIKFQADDGLGGNTTYFELDGGNTLNRFYKNVLFQDNVNASFGGSFDLRIFHDGSNSYIDEVGTGSLFIKTSFLKIRNNSNESMISAISDAEVSLYYDNIKKFETTTTGVTVTGTAKATAIEIESAVPSVLFDETDVTANWRNRVQSGGYRIQYASDGTTFVDYLTLGASANTIEKETTFKGDLTVDGASITIDTDTAGTSLVWKESDSSTTAGQLRGYSNRGDIYLYNEGVKKTEISSAMDSFIPAIHIGGTTAATGGVLQTTGSVNIDGNADISLNLIVSGSVGIGLTNPLAKLDVDGVIRSTDNNSGDYIDIYCDGSVSGNSIIESSTNNIEIIPQTGILQLKGSDFGSGQNAELQIFNSSDVVKVKLSTSGLSYFNGGNVGIGTTSPSSLLHISSTSFNDHITLTRSTDELGITVSGGQILVEGGLSPFSNINEDLGRTDKHWKQAFIYSIRSGGVLKFKSNGNNERMRIDASGNVGIGTTNPSSKLTVSGPATPSLSNGENSIRIENHTSANASPGQIGNGINFAQKWWSGSAALQVTGGIYGIKNAANGTYGGGLAFYTQPSSAADMAQRMIIDTYGNVGINVTDPEKKLEVKSDTTYDGIMIDVLSAPEITFRDRGNSDTRVGTGRHGLDGFHIDTYSGNALFIKGSNRFVGIGVTAPIVPLHISGTAVNNPSNGTGGYEVMQIFDTTSYAAGVGGGIGFGGDFTSNNNTIFSEIRGLKENATDNNYAGALSFSTRLNGASITERMRINSAGNVGIGTASPFAKLHVKNGNTLSSALANTSALIEGFSQSILQIASHSSGFSQIAFGDQDDGFDGGFIYSNASRYLSIETANAERIRINSVGNVGIGTTTPDRKLEVDFTNSVYGLKLTRSDGTGSSLIELANTAGVKSVMGYDAGTDGFKIGGLLSTRLLVKNNGNVGIGITNPTEKLVIDGKVIIANANPPNNFAQLNIGWTGGGETRAIDIDGNWGANESKSITFTYGSLAANMVGQINCQHTGPGSRIRWGRFYHNGLSSVYPMQLISTSTTTANLTVDGSIKMADDTATPSATKVGTMRYRTGTEYVEVTGTELITNGDFATSSDWSLTANVAISGGKLNFTNATTNTHFANQVISAPLGNVYKIVLEVSNLGSGESIKIRFPFQDTSINANGTYTIVGTSTAANAFRITPNSSTATFSIDNVSVIEVTAEDASYADMCMQTGASTYEWVNIVTNTY